MGTEHNVGLSVSEISHLWTSYQNDSMAICGIKYFLANIEDNDIREVLEYALEISIQHIEKVKTILNDADYPIPQGFTEKDVNLDAPRLFSDKLMMYHIAALVGSGIGQYGMAMSTSPRHDLGVMYTRLTGEIMHYSEDGANLMINNGWMEQPPQAADRIELAKKDN